MKLKLYSKWRLISGVVTLLIGILLIFSQGAGAYVLVGVGCGYILTAFVSNEKMVQVVEHILSHSDIIFFRILELLSIGLMFLEGYTIIGLFAFISLITVEILSKKKKGM